MATKARNYKQEYAEYQGTPQQLKNRAARNKARHDFEVANGDLPRTMDVDHKLALSRGGKSGLGNLRAVTQAENRSFSRTKKGALKSQTSKREASK